MADAVDGPSVLLVNPMDKVRPEVMKLTDPSVADHVDLRVLLPETCRGSLSRTDGVTYLFYDARFVPNIRYTLPTPSFVRTLRGQCESVDIVHTLGYVYLPSLVTTMLTARRETATVITVDAFPGESWSYGNRLVDAVASVYTHLFAGPMFDIADAVVGLGAYSHDDFETFVDDDRKVSVIPNGVDTARYSPPDTAYQTDGCGVAEQSDAGGAAERSEGSGMAEQSDAERPAAPVELLYVGRLDTVKGLPYLFEAMAKLRQRDTRPYTLTVVGDGSRRDDWAARCRELGIADRVTFEGWQSDVVPYYRTHDMLVLPSISEGLPTVLTEAQACGLPVVSTDVGGAREQVRGGRVVPTEDADALAEAIDSLAAEDLARRGREARAHVRENYSLAAMSDAYVELYDSLSGSVTERA